MADLEGMPRHTWVCSSSRVKRHAAATLALHLDVPVSDVVDCVEFRLQLPAPALKALGQALAQVFGADLSAFPGLVGSSGAGILLRVFCPFYGDRVVLLLSGLDKGASPKAQPRAIEAARGLLAEWRAEQAAARRRVRGC